MEHLLDTLIDQTDAMTTDLWTPEMILEDLKRNGKLLFTIEQLSEHVQRPRRRTR